MRSKMRSLFRLIFVYLPLVSLTAAEIRMPVGPHSSPEPKTNASNGSNWLTPEILGMRRSSMRFGDIPVRLFNGRGAISVRDQSVTGLQILSFPPVEVPTYNFSLAFREAKTNVLIQDIVPDVFQHLLETGKGANPMGLNFWPGTPYVLLWQRAYWQPNAIFRTGTFHKVFDGYWISFGITTKASVSAKTDEVYLAVEIENREAEPLSLTVIPNQRASALAEVFPSAGALGANTSDPAGPTVHPDAFTITSKQVRITVESDLSGQTKQGWKWEIPGKASRTAYFAIAVQKSSSPAPTVFAPSIPQQMTQADLAWRNRLRSATENIPQVSSDDLLLNDFYRRCILSVLESKWNRENFAIRPFYAVGTWTDSVAWDTSYASELLSYQDPVGLRKTLLAYLRAGLLKVSYIPWNGKASDYWYAQSPFAAMRILQDYLGNTGDVSFLEQTVGGETVFENMKQVGVDLERRFGRPDGLLDFGAGSGKMIELRTDGYQHIVAATNGLAFEYFRQLGKWCAERHDPAAAQFNQWAKRIQESMNKKLWNRKEGWFVNLYPDGSRHLVWSYHEFELLDTGMLSMDEQQRMIDHLKEGEFLGPYGMYSISKSDQIHWDREDADFGGGGQYAGEPLRISESLYRIGNSELAWDILSRCVRWAQYYPYIPQSIFTDHPGNTQVEMPLEISAGSGVQAILFGVFGLRPHQNGSLDISPSYHHELGIAQMTGYRFRGHIYDVVMGPWNYEVYRDGKLAASSVYGKSTAFSVP